MIRPSITLALPFLFCCCLSSAEEKGNETTKDSLLVRLRHQEGLVRAIECNYEVTSTPTSPDQIPRIKEICTRRGKPKTIARYIFTDKLTAPLHVKTHWLRKGELERRETFIPDGRGGWTGPVDIQGFDGNIVRTLTEKEATKPRVSLDTVETAHWRNANRPHPLNFLQCYQDKPHSHFISNSESLSISNLQQGDAALTEVSLQCKELEPFSLKLIYDTQFRLMERQLIDTEPKTSAKYIRERHIFRGHQPHNDASGETIWFPTKVSFMYFLGVSEDGTPVDYNSEEYLIHDIRFNTSIPDDAFVVPIPPGAEVFDQITGSGYLGDPDKQGRPWYERRRLWRLVAALACTIAIVIVAAIVRIRQGRAKPDLGPDSTGSNAQGPSP